MQKDNILEVKNLSISFKTEEGVFDAVKNISFALPRGKTVGIVGESGSGKSVTSLSLMQLLNKRVATVEAGQVSYQPEKEKAIHLLQLPKKKMQKIRGSEIAMIFQEPMTSLNPVLTCGSQVSEALRLHEKLSKSEAKARTIALFKEVQLPRPEKIYTAYPHQLSGGQKQRVMIAMAISCNPSILIADEPTTALDVTVQKTILELLQRLKEERNMTVIFITHDLGVIGEIADEVIVMYQGEIVEQGKVEQIFHRPRHPYTKGLLACRPSTDLKLYKLPTISDFISEKEQGIADIHSIIERFKLSEEEYQARQQQLSQKEPILKVENLQTWFPLRGGFFRKIVDHVKAVDGVSFEVYPGETMGLVGESGCGKTTLGRTILRLEEAKAGKVWFKGKELLSLDAKKMREVRKDFQIIFQDPYSSLNPRIPIGSAILEPMQVHGLHGNQKTRKEKVYGLLEKVGLSPDHYYRFPHEFSGGQRQRIGIARALAVEPEFIICDESVSALDVSVQAQVLNLLIDLREEYNLSYIFISHDLSVVKFISDRLMVMNNGKIIETGYAEKIYENPQNPYTKALIEAIPKGI